MRTPNPITVSIEFSVLNFLFGSKLTLRASPFHGGTCYNVTHDDSFINMGRLCSMKVLVADFHEDEIVREYLNLVFMIFVIKGTICM